MGRVGDRSIARTPGGAARLAAIGLAALVGGAAGSAFAGPDREVVVRGQVTDEEGAPVTDHAVRLLKARTIISIEKFNLKKRSQDLEETRTTTDGHGFFEFTFPVDPEFRYYYLRFYDPETFDAVRFRVPEDRDISRRARKGRQVHASVTLRFHPDWAEVRTLIDRHGETSHRGRILRALGLPDSRTEEGDGRVVWSYEAEGVSYVLEGDRVVETRGNVRARTPAEKPAEQIEEGEREILDVERVDEEDVADR